MPTCKKCGVEILWSIVEASGKSLPLDPRANSDGNVVIVDYRHDRGRSTPVVRVLTKPELADTPPPRYVHHRVTCEKEQKP